MSRVAIITDTHWGARNESREFLNHFIKFYKEIFFPELERRNITKIFHLGDIVDRRKFINFVVLNAMREHFIEAAEQRNMSLDILVGNHDIPYRNSNEINAIGEAFQKYSHIKLYSKPEEINVDGLDILMMPWINSTNYQHAFDMIKDTKAQILFGHLEIKGFEMYRGLPSFDGYEAALFDKFDIVASGHFHKKSTNGNIHYLGAPYEITWSDYDCPRGFHIFDTETRTFEYVRNHLHMFHKVWYNDEGKTVEDLPKDFSYLKDSYVKVIIQQKDNPYHFDLFMNAVYNSNPIEVTVVEDHKNLQNMSEEDIVNSAEDTPTILSNYVEKLDTKVDKTELANLLREIYNDAMSIEVADRG